MRNIILSSFLLLSGCYMANGSPPASTYWIKNGIGLSYKDADYCYEKSKIEALNKKELNKFLYLDDKFNKNPIDMINNHKDEYKEYNNLMNKISLLHRQCFYDLGYRFQAPLYWCLAQDGDNTRICMENMKYRN